MIPDGWQVRRLGDFCKEVVRRGEGAELPILSVGKNYGLKPQTEKFKRRVASADTSRYKRICLGQFAYDPMLLWSGSIGRQKRVPEGIISPAYYVFEADASVDADFLEFLLRRDAMLPFYRDISQGTNVRRRKASFTDFGRIAVALPTLREQRMIATILSCLEETTEKTKAVIDQLEVVKKSLLSELLSRGVPGRHTEFAKTEMGDFPRSWKIDHVGNCCVVENNLRKPINREQRASIAGPFPYYGPTKVLDYINEFRIKGTYALIGEDGDHFLKFAQWPMTQLVSGYFNVNNHAHVVRGTDTCMTEWFHLFFLHRDITEDLTRQGANRYKLKKETLLRLPIVLPPVGEQREIVDAIGSFAPAIASNREFLVKLNYLRSALGDALFSGRVRVNVPSQEAA